MNSQQQILLNYSEYNSAEELNDPDRQLLDAAKAATALAYAPYSKFNVGAAGRLYNGEIITGGNLENVSFPAGLCAEGVVLASAAARFPGVAMEAMAISYRSSLIESDHPIAPCGICRQSLQEFSNRTHTSIKLILGGEKGKIFIIENAATLLPFAFKF
ncbi:MAG: cytidine deaminase [Flavitalea sp.]